MDGETSTKKSEPANLTRRNFLKGGAAGLAAGLVIGAGGMAGLNEWKQSRGLDFLRSGTTRPTFSPLAGAPPGLMAAIWAKDAGVESMILEKAPALFGSATSICGGGWVVGGGTSTQKAQGIDDTPEEFYDYLMTHSKVPSDPEMVRTFIEESRKVYEWVVGLGVECVSLAAYWGMKKPRCHWTDTVKTIQLLEQECKNKDIEILFETPATRLITNSEGRVVGAEASSYGETVYVKARKGVVLGTGGFSANPEMLYDFHGPAVAKMMPVGSPNDTGDGYKMAMALGANVIDLFVLPDMAIAARDTRITLAQIPRDGGIMVNKDGKSVSSMKVFSVWNRERQLSSSPTGWPISFMTPVCPRRCPTSS